MCSTLFSWNGITQIFNIFLSPPERSWIMIFENSRVVAWGKDGDNEIEYC